MELPEAEVELPEMPPTTTSPIKLEDGSFGCSAQLQEVNVNGKMLRIGYPAFDTSMDFVIEDQVDLSNVCIKVIADNREQHRKCTAVVVARYDNYTLMQTPVRGIGTIAVRRNEWKINDNEDLPQFGTWWWLTIGKYEDKSIELDKEIRTDIDYLAITTPRYLNSEYHPLNGRMRGFGKVIEFYLDFDLSKKKAVELINITTGFATTTVYLLRHRLGLEVILQKRYLYSLLRINSNPKITIELWAILRPDDDTGYLLYLQPHTSIIIKREDGTKIEVMEEYNDDDED